MNRIEIDMYINKNHLNHKSIQPVQIAKVTKRRSKASGSMQQKDIYQQSTARSALAQGGVSYNLQNTSPSLQVCKWTMFRKSRDQVQNTQLSTRGVLDAGGEVCQNEIWTQNI